MGLTNPEGYDIRCQICGCGRRDHGLDVEVWTPEKLPQGGSILEFLAERKRLEKRSSRRRIGEEENVRTEEAPWTELQVEDLRAGNGELVKDGDVLYVHYTGRLRDSGQVFETTRNGGDPFRFRLGAWDVIPAWEQGVQGMRKGGLRRISAPEFMCYGSSPVAGVIHADLIFDIELMDIGEIGYRCTLQ